MTIMSNGDFRKLMNATMRLSAPCRKCGRPIQFEEGANLARDSGIHGSVVQCSTCRSVYTVDVGVDRLTLVADVTADYPAGTPPRHPLFNPPPGGWRHHRIGRLPRGGSLTLPGRHRRRTGSSGCLAVSTHPPGGHPRHPTGNPQRSGDPTPRGHRLLRTGRSGFPPPHHSLKPRTRRRRTVGRSGSARTARFARSTRHPARGSSSSPARASTTRSGRGACSRPPNSYWRSRRSPA